MNQREKVLALGVGVVGTLFLGNMLYSSIQSGFREKEKSVSTLKNEVEDQELNIERGLIATQKIRKAAERSISKRPEIARTDYQKWLSELAEKSQIENPRVVVESNSADRDGFKTFKFSLTGEGDLVKATKLLYNFYSKPTLHRITKFDLAPISNAKDKISDKLKISLQCDVLAIPAAKDVQALLPADESLLPKPFIEYQTTIANRNLFSPANQAPKLAAKKSVEAPQGSRVDYAVNAEDPDTNQTVSYALDGEAPAGLKIDSKTGKIDWTGKELGEYKINVVATDSGVPAKTASQEITIRVVTAPPPRPEPKKFDVASQAKLTGLVSGRDGAEAWIFSKTEGKTHTLKVGDQLKLGELQGKVTAVGSNYIEVESEGKTWTVGIEETISDAYNRDAVQ